jgi:uncharacterized beta-barrel protein YwiB (DUF1934 family)
VGKQIQLTITGIHHPPRTAAGISDNTEQRAVEPVVTRQEVQAEYFRRGDSHYLFYQEQPEGYPQPLQTRVKLKSGCLEIHRQGIMGSHLVFEEDKSYRTDYGTLYGTLALDVVTTSVQVAESKEDREEWPGVAVVYVLEESGAPLGEYCLRIERADQSKSTDNEG